MKLEAYINSSGGGGGEGGVLPSSWQIRMCRWMGSNCFTTGLTIMGLHFYKSYLNGVAHFQDFRGQKIQV